MPDGTSFTSQETSQVEDQTKAHLMADAEKPDREMATVLKAQAEKTQNKDQAEVLNDLAATKVAEAITAGENKGIKYDEKIKQGLQYILKQITENITNNQTEADSSLAAELVSAFQEAKTLDEIREAFSNYGVKKNSSRLFGAFGLDMVYYREAGGVAEEEGEETFVQLAETTIGMEDQPFFRQDVKDDEDNTISIGLYKTAMNSAKVGTIVWVAKNEDGSTHEKSADTITFMPRETIDDIQLNQTRKTLINP